MKFLDMLTDIPRQVAAVRESISDVTSNDVDRMGNRGDRPDRGYRGINRMDRRHKEAILKLTRFLSDCYSGRRPMWHLQEAMTTADFPNLFGDVLYRQLLGNYMPYPVTYTNYFRMMDAPDFRVLHMYAIDGGQGLLGVGGNQLTPIGEREPYPEIKLVETPYSVQVKKYGRRYGVSFEMMVMDDLNAFSQRPGMMATGARRSEEFLATTMMADANGPNATFFGHAIASGPNAQKAGNVTVDNLVANQPPLSQGGLQAAMTQIKKAKDRDGQPIVVDMFELVVPPALEITAQNMLKASDLRLMQTPGVPIPLGTGADVANFLYVANWMSSKIRLSVNPYLPYISTANGDTSWYLIANPNNYTQRPAFVFAFLRGRRQPQLFLKDPDQRLLGGGDSDPMEGNFDNDSIDYKMRHIFGAAQVDPVMAIASNGTGIN